MALLIFIIVLGVLILIHEFGHFLFARFFGVGVERFSIGFGPILTRIRGAKTEYCISAIPLGGYVKLAGESIEDQKGEAWEFGSHPIWQRTLIILAGPLANSLLAFLVFWTIFIFGNPTLPNQVGQVSEGYPAQSAGIQVGDRILAINGERVEYWDQISKKIRQQGLNALTLLVERQGKESEIILSPRIEERQNILKQKIQIPLIGVSPKDEVVYARYPVGKALVMAVEELVLFTQVTFQALWLMVTGALPFKESMTGPIGIFYIAKGAVQLGLSYLLRIVGTISASLAIFNVLPIPVLDGGHLFFLFFEAFKGKPLSQRTQAILTQCGTVFLIAVMVFVFYNDLIRFGVFEKFLSK